MKTYKLIFLILIFSSSVTLGQNGFVKTMNDSIIEGFIKYDYELYNPEKGVKIKVYRTKKDRHPFIFYEMEVFEHSFNNDHYINLFNVTPEKNEPQKVHDFVKTEVINRTNKYSLVSFVASHGIPGRPILSNYPGGVVQSTGYIGGTPANIDYLLVNNYTRDIER